MTSQAAHQYDLFNGDADGLCGLHQLRLAEPCKAELVTGTKREIDLFRRVPQGNGLAVTALDISFDRNRDEVYRVLLNGGSIRYFDHHAAHTVFEHPRLETHIDTRADNCTSLLVDRYLKGRYRAWAVVGTFGDNLGDIGTAMASEIGFRPKETASLRRLGELLNYNAYGETVTDLHQHPAALYKELSDFEDPLEFVTRSHEFERLSDGFEADQSERTRLKPHWQDAHVLVYVLPGMPWARRMSGTLANELSSQERHKSIALLTPRTDGNYLVSVRLSPSCAESADVFCSRFPGGGGRRAAGGIDRLEPDRLSDFVVSFSHFVKGVS